MRRTGTAGRWILASLAMMAALGCARMSEEGDFEQLGLVGASSEPPPGVHNPVEPGDLTAIHDRGRLLHQLEKALRLAYVDGVYTVGSAGTDAVLPLVDVDPGGRSAQVLFVRWRPDSAGTMPALSAKTAERWLMVSLLLSPDRVLDVEVLSGPLEDGSHMAHRVDTVVTAAERVQQMAPGEVFHLFDLYEQVPVEPGKPIKGTRIQGHVYALSGDGDGTDLEVVVDPPKKRKGATVLDAWTVHTPGAVLNNPIEIDTASPGPITVVRAMMRGLDAGTVEVVSSDGTWTVASGTGLLRRAGEAPAGP